MVWYCTDCVVEVESDRDMRRPRVPLVISRSFEGRRRARCDKGKLVSFVLRSLKGLFPTSFGTVHDCFCGLYFGMRLDAARALEESELLLDNEGNDGAGEPDDRGSETQSSERESSQACSIAKILISGCDVMIVPCMRLLLLNRNRRLMFYGWRRR